MKNAFLTATLFGVIVAAAASADWMSRYWDGCKPSCSWSGKPTAAGMGQCKECNRQDQLMSTNDGNSSACDGGTSYTCWDMSPVAVDATMAYGFVASNPSKMSCGSCYELTFTGEGQHGTGPSHRALQGKKMIVMASNIGGDVHNDQFDLLVPGGGVGQFDAFSNQIGKSKSELGAQYGGLLADCPNNNTASLEANQSCLKNKCAQVFAGKDKLKAGCDFYADWLMGANNPKFTSRSIDCPEYLKTAYKSASGTPPGEGGGGVPPIVDPPNPPDSGGAVVAKVEAETSTPTLSNCVEGNDNQSMCIGSGNGITNIGYIKNGDATTYTVNVPKSGTYTMEFRIALNESDVQSSSFTVTVNGQNVGTVSSNGTGGWNTYQTVRLGSKVQFNQGSNTVVLNFQNSINVDYFQLIGEAEQVSVRYNTVNKQAKPRAAVTLTASLRGFTAALPANHGYTAYKLVDLQGREVRSGKIGDGTSSLKFNNLKSSVLLLRLEGKNTSTVVKAITY